ncbi:MAG: AAA family ATPase [Patescibacteria group bacterium]|nr:AAA family ATPase [Patescibacteria group bacterium]
MMDESLFYLCPSCQGQGYQGKKKCQTCFGLGVWQVYSDKKLFFDWDLSSSVFIAKKIKKFFGILIYLFLFSFGLIGFLSLLQAIFSFKIPSNFLPLFQREKFFLMKIFWLSLLTDLFLVYSKIQRKPSFLRIFKEKKEKINVAHYLSAASERVLTEAIILSRKLFHQQINPVHLFIGLLQSEVGFTVLGRLGLNWTKLKEAIAKILREIPPNYERRPSLLNPETKKIILQASVLTLQKRKDLISPLAIMRAITVFEGPIKKILDEDFEIRPREIENVCLWFEIYEEIKKDWQRLSEGARRRPKGPMNVAMTAVATPFLDAFSSDLTALARLGYLGPFMDREKEIEEIFRVLETGQGNLVLVGPPGVGKTAIIEGLARKMIQNEVPKILQDKRLVSLSLGRLVAGASRPGEIEERMQIIIQEIIRAGNIILFIKDIHNLIGVKTTEGELDVAEILAEALEKKYFLLLATSTLGIYEHCLESSTLGQVLTKINIQEPDKNSAILICEAKVAAIEAKNKVFFSYGALEKAVELAERYLYEKFLPQKAIELLEEVAVFVRQRKGARAIVLKEDVAEIVAQKTGIPSEKISQEEKEKLLILEEKIHERIVNQEEAVHLVASAIRRARTELRDPKKPIVNLLFLGPTGVGKTELAKTVAEVYFGKEEKMIRLDMSEFQTKESLGRLIGCPSEPRGVLTEAVRRAPFSLLLLDEIEKAHPDILNLFLQVMDDGRLTDWQGKTINFTNLMIIGTSNAGTEFIQEALLAGKTIEEIKEILLKEKLSPYFRPEFLNRFDAVVIFKPLGKKELFAITQLILKKLSSQIEKKGITFQATEEAINELVEKGFDPIFGARALKRTIQEEVNNALANFLLTGKISRGDLVILEKGGKIKIERK